MSGGAAGLAIVTGATGGLGLEVAEGLARAGLEVVVTGRNAGRGREALARVQRAARGAAPRFVALDLASLASVRGFAVAIEEPVAVLVNNAGVMGLKQRELTVDGFERQWGTNYLGHFALTGLLLPRLRGGRVVNVSSLAHRRGAIGFEDLNGARGYSPWGAYSQSKLAMLMFGIELEARSAAGGWGVSGFAAHPGWSATRIVANGMGAGRPAVLASVMQAGFNALGQSAAEGARPLLFAALDAGAKPSGYYGPCCWGETRGKPTLSRVMPQAQDAAARARLWAASEVATGVSFAS